MKKTPPHELSRVVDVTKPDRVYTITPTEAERLAIAKRLGLVGLAEFGGELQVKRGTGGTTIVRGTLKAEVTQSCVVTLEPVEACIAEEVVATFSEQAAADDELDWSDDADAPEPMTDGKIDLGELLVQHLSLALDPYPRKAGAEFKGYDDPI
jgi:uncharacterized metal-binding protein YceD (DUF177 family)